MADIALQIPEEAAGATWWIASMDEFPGWLDELRRIVHAGVPH